MKSGIKKEYIILAMVIIVLGLYLLFQSKDKIHYKVPKLPALEKGDIDKIEIKKSDQTISLTKKESKWILDPQGYPTDSTKMDQIMNSISNLTLTDLVSKSKNYQLYDLQKEKAIQVKAFQKEKVLRDFEIGKLASTYGHTFVKIKDNDNVYYARDSFRNYFDVKINELRDKVVMKLDSNEVSEVTIEKGGNTYAFEKNANQPLPPSPDISKVDEKDKSDKKKDTEEKPKAEPTPPPKPEDQFSWVMPTGKKAKKSQMDALINQLANLTCQDYLEGKTKEDFKDQTPLYTLKLKGTKDYTLTFFPKIEKKEGDTGGDKYPVISSENDYPFTLASWNAEQIMKKPEELIEEEVKK